ncbi:dTDP-4-dehydrorhamnose 3,5-epimerase family protein, partial [Candidatus Pelagibacter ubique]|nr:dTDP-4-dehydrorhamnose 3,5-epimerase family protein [Candidatus Pelagibacter ubique]
KKNVLRGLHFQTKKSQAKIVTVSYGKIFDVAVDLRKNSKTFGKYYSIIISHKDNFSFYIPENFAHGFICLSDECVVNYKMSKYRYENYDRTINWKDDYLNIKWPKKNPIISKKDSYNALDFKEYYKSYFNKR